MYISKSFAVLEHNVTFNIVSRYKIIYVEIRVELLDKLFPPLINITILVITLSCPEL